MKKMLVFILTALAVVACTQSPTGRSQFIMVDGDTMAKMGVESFTAMKQEEKISTDKSLNRYVQCVATPILKTLPEGWQDDWEIVVFDSEQVNAFALPGRKIGVYTGILSVAENADQLAAIIGHEVGHVIANHSGERVSQSTAANMAMQGASILSQGSDYQQAIMTGLGLGAQFGVLLPYSRTHESEADVIGLKYLIEAGFKPEESMSLWENMNKLGGERPMEFMSTHPAPETRINNLAQHIKQYQSQGVKAKFSRPNCSK
ncbi:M48 family metallopeptidase [Catenovulum sp. 2E275]|uniref:M48 family metallopeptidase n=1 Tax=Catenovulum sp. 2E275 TaxID=2980497 RepID=UPI0021D22979|nr:M48 family metallopeptidase [Catenovulum sp. 2E275]MCU4674518.1 M48 family metallopeptidase [Catenovulum sp. 2E275]